MNKELFLVLTATRSDNRKCYKKGKNINYPLYFYFYLIMKNDVVLIFKEKKKALKLLVC